MTATTQLAELSDAEFRLFQRLVYDKAGIALSDQKKALLANRLRSRVRTLNLGSFKKYYDLLTKQEKGADELEHFLNSVTTNETYFFRNDTLWSFVGGELLKSLVETRSKSPAPALRFWSAASSSGEEAYTLAIVLQEKLPDFKKWRINIVGSDISERVLQRAREGVYNEYAMQKLDASMRRKYFTQTKNEPTFRLRDETRKLVDFRFHNLRDPFRVMKFDVVFLRNVMMYFDLEMKCRVVDNVTATMAPGAYLIIGDVDPMREGNTLRDRCPLDYVKPSIYRKPLGQPSPVAPTSAGR